MLGTMASPTLKKRVAATLFPHYSKGLDQLNGNAKVRTWIDALAPDVAHVGDKYALYDYLCARVLGAEEPIDYLEFGVYRGATMRGWLERSSSSMSRFYGFDSFEGLPESWGNSFAAGHFATNGELPEIDDPRVTFVKGWFQETLRPFLATFQPRSRLVINNDSDLYSSTLFCLTQLDAIITPGTVLIFDEFSTPLHEFRAFEDYCSAYQRQMRPIAVVSDYAVQAAFVFE